MAPDPTVATTPDDRLYTPHAQAQYEDARKAALASFEQGGRVQSLWRRLTRAMDGLLASATLEPGLALVAVGGYGRGELFPHSDIDLLVLLPDGAGDAVQGQVVALMQRLWALHGAVSHATRTVGESVAAAAADHTIAASLLDARFIAGDRALFERFREAFTQQAAGQACHGFVTAKLAERDVRHAKWGGSRFMLEPQVKEGKGALRDLQTLRWLAQYCCGEAEPAQLLSTAEWDHYHKAYRFFATVRAHMHLLRGRADERLTFDLQIEVAQRLRFRGRTAQQKAERLMRRYYQFTRETGALTRIFCAGLDAAQLRPPLPALAAAAAQELPAGLCLDEGRLSFASPEILAATPSLAVTLFRVASEQGLTIHSDGYLALARMLPWLLRHLRKDAVANREFLALLLGASAPETHLRRMNDAGVLGALMPEFERVGGMMQYDGYHTYTVDEHSLVAIGNLAQIEQGAWTEEFPLSSRVAREISDRTPLYVALLCHDLAKGTGGDHANKGAVLVAKIAARFGLTPAQQELAAWLVRHQELLSETAFKRDLDDTNTLAGFVETVQSPERLRLLLLLTVSDIKAVGPAIWNGWKGALMRDLYSRALERMGVTAGHGAPLPSHGAERMLDSLPDAARHVYHSWLAAPAVPAVAVTHDRFRAVSEVTCCMEYTPNCLRLLAGVLSYLGASIVTARSVLLEGNAALVTIGIQDIAGNSFADEGHRLAGLPALIVKAVGGGLDFARELPKRRRVSRGREVAIAPAVFVDNHASAEATVLEVNARDRIGLLYDILGGMEDCQLQVISAQLATYGSRAVDVFYVKDAYGHKLTHPTKLEQVQRSVLAVCNERAQDSR